MIKARYRLNVSLADRGLKPCFRGSFFAIKRRDNGLSHSRIGVVLSKRYSKKATARNKLKREIFNFFASNKDFLEDKSRAYDILIVILTTEANIKDNKEAFTKELNNVISI
ncbi:MAG: ribonuclease P protein component [Candidatus Colwellbacteria bacterium]|nr:ribonuclease P protein component [Candidatus Colwellbacteria bacterium]